MRSVKSRAIAGSSVTGGTGIVAGLAVLKLLIHFALNSGYGYQRDELYFIECGKRLDWGYVDVGPLTMWLGRLSREAFGESLFALRFFPAVAGALMVLMTGLLARRLGGGRFAQFLAALAALVSPFYLGSGNVLALPSFEPLIWVTCAYLIVGIIQSGTSRGWLLVGLVAGIGLLNKPSMLFFGGGLLVGLLLTPQRRFLLDKWLWLGGLAAVVLASPYLYWQITHGWATWVFMSHLNRDVMSRIGRIEFLAGQLLYVHPLSLPIWLAGLWFYFRKPEGKAFRLLGWLFVTVFALLFASKSKVYYLLPAYPMLLAAGAYTLEQWAPARNARAFRIAYPVALAATGILFVPVVLPVLPIEKTSGYTRALTLGLLKNVYEINNTFRDQFGWENQAAVVAQVYKSLPPQDQKICMIFAGNFGEAGAIDFYGRKYGLPKATSFHQNYYFWGLPEHTEVAIVIGLDFDELKDVYAEVNQAGLIACNECVYDEQRIPVYVCRQPIVDLRTMWPTLREVAFNN